MFGFLAYTVAVALAAAFGLALCRKWGWLEWAQVHSGGLIYEALSCHFCLSFWAGVVLSVVAAAVTQNWWLLACPVCSTPITVRLW